MLGKGTANTGSLHGVYGPENNTAPSKGAFACGVAAGVWKSSGQVWYMAVFQHSGGELFFNAFSGRMMTVSAESGG